MKVFASILLCGCLGVLGLAALDPAGTFGSPTRIFWWVAAPGLGAALAAGLLALRPTGRLALASLVVAVAVLEAGVWAVDVLTGPDVETWIDPEYYQDNPTLGYGPKPGITAHSWKRVNGTTVYDVEYSIDARGRRVTPPATRGDRSRFLLCFGGSSLARRGLTGHRQPRQRTHPLRESARDSAKLSRSGRWIAAVATNREFARDRVFAQARRNGGGL